MEVLDSRRLTGPSLIWQRPGAVLDVKLDTDEAETLISHWESNVRDMLMRLGLGSEILEVRRYPNGASLAISAPMDALYAATAINDWAWAAATGVTEDGDKPDDVDAAAAKLSDALEQERKPALIALMNAAESKAVPCLVDDDEITLGLGKYGQTWPVDSLPETDAVEWGKLRAVPLGLITGTNGKTTSVRFLTQIAMAAGHTPGVSSTDWIAVGEEILDRDDWSGPGGARTVLRDPRVTLGLLETARGGLLRRGLGIASADAALITNIAEDHLGEFGVMNIEELADVKWVVTSAIKTGGRAILNAQDPLLVARAAKADFAFTWFSLDPDLPLIKDALANGERAVVLRGDDLLLIKDGTETLIATVGDIPLTLNGAARHNIANALGAIGFADALGIEPIHIAAGLAATTGDDNPGRCNLFHVDGFDVLVDFAHNPHGMQAILELASRMEAKRRLLLIGQAGDRTDEAIRELAAGAWKIGLERVLIKEMPRYARGREPDEVAQIIRRALLDAGADESRIDQFETEPEAVDAALEWAQAGDLLILFVHDQIDDVLQLLKRRAGG